MLLPTLGTVTCIRELKSLLINSWSIATSAGSWLSIGQQFGRSRYKFHETLKNHTVSICLCRSTPHQIQETAHNVYFVLLSSESLHPQYNGVKKLAHPSFSRFELLKNRDLLVIKIYDVSHHLCLNLQAQRHRYLCPSSFPTHQWRHGIWFRRHCPSQAWKWYFHFLIQWEGDDSWLQVSESQVAKVCLLAILPNVVFIFLDQEDLQELSQRRDKTRYLYKALYVPNAVLGVSFSVMHR